MKKNEDRPEDKHRGRQIGADKEKGRGMEEEIKVGMQSER